MISRNVDYDLLEICNNLRKKQYFKKISKIWGKILTVWRNSSDFWIKLSIGKLSLQLPF